MIQILTKAACFVAIILLGYTMKRKAFFQASDFHLLSKIVLKITLPAAIITNLSGQEISIQMLTLSLFGLCGGLLYMLSAYLINIRASKDQQAFAVLNSSGYNIGNFAMPFIQNFLGPGGVLATSLFDVGNAFICLGGAYSIAASIKGGGEKISFKKIGTTLLKSVPFDCYVFMAILALFHLRLPSVITQFSGIIGNANAFLSMLMLGVGFNLSSEKEQLGKIAKILLLRYSIAAALSIGFYLLLPFGEEYRTALAILAFAPIASAAPAFTGELKSDIGLASSINSFSILISVFCMICVLTILA